MIPKLSDRKQTRLHETKGLGRGLTAQNLRELFRVMKLLVLVCEDGYRICIQLPKFISLYLLCELYCTASIKLKNNKQNRNAPSNRSGTTALRGGEHRNTYSTEPSRIWQASLHLSSGTQ